MLHLHRSYCKKLSLLRMQNMAKASILKFNIQIKAKSSRVLGDKILSQLKNGRESL